MYVRDGAGNDSRAEVLNIFRDESVPEAQALGDAVGARLVSQNPTNRQTATVQIHVNDADSRGLMGWQSWNGGLGTEYRVAVGSDGGANIELAPWRPVES